MKNKRGFELAISTLILIIIGIVVLIALTLAFTGQFQYFLNTIKGYSGSDMDNLNKMCQSQCGLGNGYSFCCEEKELGRLNIKCTDKKLDVECNINCEEIC